MLQSHLLRTSSATHPLARRGLVSPANVRIALGLLACLSLASCDKNSTRGTSNGPNASTAPVGGNQNVSFSTLRERAIQMVEDTAKSSDPVLRANAVEAASYAPARLRPVIESGLRDSHPGVRAVTAFAIGKSKISGHAPGVNALLNDPVSIVRISAIYAAIRNGATVDRSPLGAVLMSDPSPSARRQAADILGLLGDESARPLLRDAANAKFSELPPSQVTLLRLQIAAALVRLGDEAQRPVVRAGLYPSTAQDLEAAVLAAQLLGELGDVPAQRQLVALDEYRDRNGQEYPPELRLAIATALAQLGKTEGSFVADKFLTHPSPAVRAQVAFTYGATRGPQNAAKVQTLLDAPEPQVQIAAAGAILKALARR
jgi:HEAT repeat protein